MDLLRKVEVTTADFENEHAYQEMAALKEEVARGLATCEANYPPQCHCVVAHEVMHVPDAIYRWNCVRNYWAFHLER